MLEEEGLYCTFLLSLRWEMLTLAEFPSRSVPPRDFRIEPGRDSIIALKPLGRKTRQIFALSHSFD